MRITILAVAAFLGAVLASTAFAEVDHAQFVEGATFKSGQEVTAKCLECHDKEAADLMKTTHWKWSKEQDVNGKKMELGKKNVINNFCLAVPGNWPGCTICHAGYDWKDGSYDFSKAENVDCLACHDTTGSYKKVSPAVQPDPKLDLAKLALKVGATSRKSCGSCHFYGGGGDHVKHGDLDSSLTNPTAEIDVHMGGQAKMECTGCHSAEKHAIKGQSLTIAGSNAERIACTDCHSDAKIHKNQFVEKHIAKVACQACHIPTIAKSLPTKVWWDWSKAGKNIKPKKDAFGMDNYLKIKGEFKWNKNFAPELLWYNGKAERILPGDKINPAKVVKLNSPQGNRFDKNSKLMPFKVMRGKQPYDSGNNTMAFAKLFNGYWKDFNWDKAIEEGMKAGGQPYSGKYGFVETSMAMPVNHMVAPKEQAFRCTACHGSHGKLDWKALGYENDPILKKKK
ncbi:MAG: tetrathionate reductase family octaheme c-type cytochrome [Syntrophobacterales bacterium]|nr:tetrathionate reductase family octaheme c-type cytochrome [Syntrophobacterales bacterium]